MTRILIALLLTGCAGSAPALVSDVPPTESGLGGVVTFDPSVPTRWVQDHQDQYGFGGVKSIEHVSMRHIEMVESGVRGYVDARYYTVHTRDRGAIHILTTERNYDGELVVSVFTGSVPMVSVFTGSVPTNDRVFICGRMPEPC